MAKPQRILAGGASGLIALVAFLGVAELVAVVVGPRSAPSIAIGQNVVAHVPENLKDFAIRHFGENDKTVLLDGLYATMALVAAIVGAVASLTRRSVAISAIIFLGILAAISAATQANASFATAVPSIIGAAAGIACTIVLIRDMPAPVVGQPSSGDEPTSLPRRRFLAGAASLAAFGGAAYVLGKYALGTAYNAAKSRAAVVLPRPVSRGADVRGTDLAVPGLAPYITANADFYRVDTALVVPQVTTEEYSLNVHGMVARPMTLSFEDLLRVPLIERAITMVCVSNPVGGPYIGNARWLGAPLGDLLRKAGVDDDADQLFMTSADGMTIGADLKAVMDGRPAMLAVGMNGEPLPFEHGFPVRAIVPGIYGYASACKWLVDLEITTYAAKKAYWVQRGYAEKAPVKLEAKIDTPQSFAQLKPGPVTVSGAAWRPGVGIRKVELRADNGHWEEASLAAVESSDTWRLWKWEWKATPGSHTLQLRAEDAQGNVQTAAEAPVLPNGSSGRQSVVVTVT